MEVLWGDGIQRRELVNACVVDRHIQLSVRSLDAPLAVGPFLPYALFHLKSLVAWGGGEGLMLHENPETPRNVEVFQTFLLPKAGDFACLRTRPAVPGFDLAGRPMKGEVLVEPEGVESDGPSVGWIQRAVKLVGALPAK